MRRRAIRSSLTEWARFKGFDPATHHLYIVDQIEDFLDSDEEVCLLAAPPGSAKSTYISRLLVSSYLAKNPTHSVLAATHSMEFAERWGRQIRNDIAAEGAILGLSLAEDSQAATRWALKSGGEYYGVSATAGISGFRADLGIGDDFFGSREDALSETVRKKRWSWYVSDFSARLKPGAKRILMNTRWHDDDVAGQVEKQIAEGVVSGRIIKITAIALEDDPLGRAPGEYLWDDPEGYNYGSYLRARQREETPVMWSALYQQNPVPEEGAFLDVAKVQRIKPPPVSELRIFAASDYATSDGSGDYTVHAIGGLDEEDNLHVLDWWRKQTTTDVWIDQMKNMVRSWAPLEWGEEGGVIIKAVSPQIDARLSAEPKAYVSRVQYPSIRDKPTRARPLQARIAMGKLCISPDAYWADELISELSRFPAAKYDDQVDALALLAVVAATRGPPTKTVSKSLTESMRTRRNPWAG